MLTGELAANNTQERNKQLPAVILGNRVRARGSMGVSCGHNFSPHFCVEQFVLGGLGISKVTILFLLLQIKLI